MAGAPSFRNPKCNVEGCPRQGETMVRSSYRVLFVRGTEQREEVVIYRFVCRTTTAPQRHFHNTYFGPQGESLEQIASGHFRFTDATTQELIEIVAGSKADKRPFPNPKCEKHGCQRQGMNLWLSDQRAMAVKRTGGRQTVIIYSFSCILQKPSYRYIHSEYVGPHGEPVTHSAKGHFSFTDSVSGALIETESSHPRAMADPARRKKISKGIKRSWKENPEARLPGIRRANANPVRRAKISAALRQRWANHPEERQKYSARQKASWASLTPAQRRRKTRRQMRGCRTPEAIQRKSESLKRAWAEKKAKLAALLKVAKDSLPSDSKERPRTWRIAGMLLLEKDRVSNREVGSAMDELGVRCPYGRRNANGIKESITWVAYFAERRGWVWMNEIRNWVDRPGI